MKKKVKKRYFRWMRIGASVITAFSAMVVGGIYCVMTHLPDSVGTPLLTAGFFMVMAASCWIQEEIDRVLSEKYNSGPPVYRTEGRKNENNRHLRRHGRSAGKVGSRRVA